MGCECIPPPPVFDLPPPPDPTAIWHLISDEPEDVIRKVRLESCEFSPFFQFVGLDGNIQNLLLFGAGCVLIILLTVYSITICWQKLCSGSRSKRSPGSSRFNSSSDTIVTGPSTSHWSVRSPKMNSTGMPLYGSASASNISGSNSTIRNQPKMGSSTLRLTRPQQLNSRTAALRVIPDHQGTVYCTLNRHYEEIPVNYALPPSALTQGTLPQNRIPSSISYNPILPRGQSIQFEPTGAMVYLDRVVQHIDRKPPPTCRPPPVPTDSISTEDLENSSIDAEIEVINQNHLSSSPPNSRQSEFGGRESGYGTGPSRLWNVQSPKAPPRSISKEHKSPSATNSSLENSPPTLTVFDRQNPMTYV
ncbi:hypothetical protein FO519_008355 [Halicephalobus sp. NKZ332]|nr:hypothetical protein FO519_008355 [Halicephalobus sp. NKZ332]